MDMSEVKAFNAELSGLYDNKPPISKAKMSAITRGAIKAIKFYKHVVHSVEKFIQKCKPEYKVPGLYVIDSIVRQSRHQFGQDKDVFAPRFAKNMQQTFANLFKCPPEDKRNIIRVLNLWQKNNVFSPEVIQPLLDMADPNHPLHQEIQQNNANGSSLNVSHNASDNKISPAPAPQHTPHSSTPMGDQFQDQPSSGGVKFNRKLLNDFEYDSEDDTGAAEPLSQSTHQHQQNQHHHQHQNQHHQNQHQHQNQHHQNQHQHQNQQQTNNPADALGSILTNPEIMRQLQSLQAQMQMMTGMQIPNLMPMMSDMQLQQNQNQNLPFLGSQQDLQKQGEGKDDMANESDIEFVETGPQVIEIPDANDSRSPSPKRRHRSRSRSPKRRRRSRSRSRSPRRRRDRDRERDRDRDRDRDKEKNYKEREAEREKQKEREKKGLPPIKKENLSVCSTTLWVGHLSKLATQEELSDLFGSIGGVVSIDVVGPRGCAFVVMERRRDAHKALQKLNKHKLHSKEITVAWAPGKGVKGREWKDYWEAELGVSYLPWSALHQRWQLGALSLDALEEGGSVDEETLPPWLPPRILPKLDTMPLMPPGMAGPGMIPNIPPGAVPNLPLPAGAMPPASMPGGTLPQASLAGPLPTGSLLGAPLASQPAPAIPMQVTRMPPPGLPAGIPPGMAPGMPPGIRPPSIPSGVPGLQGDAGLPPAGPLLGFPPGLPPQSLTQPGMVGGFLGGLLGAHGLVGGVPLPMPVHPTHAHAHQVHTAHIPRPAEVSQTDDAMDLDPEDGHEDSNSQHQPQHQNQNKPADTSAPPPLLSEQLQAMMSKPPPNFNAAEPPPGFNLNEPPPFNANQPPPNTEEKQEEHEERKSERDRDRRDRDRRDRDRDNRDRRDRGDRDNRDNRDNRRDRDRGRDRDRDRDDRRDRDRDRGGRDRRDRDRDRDRDRFSSRDNNRERSREKSPRTAAPEQNSEKTLQERLWEMANGKPADINQEKAPEYQEPERPDREDGARIKRPMDRPGDRPMDRPTDRPMERPNERPMERPPMERPPPLLDRIPPLMDEGEKAPDGPEGGWTQLPPRLPPPHLAAPPFRAELRMRGPPRQPMRGPWMEGPGPGPGPMGPRFNNGMGPPFNRPPFERPPFEGGPLFDGPPRFERPPFNRMPFNMNRPPFDGPRPPFDGPRPPFDGPRPPFDGPRPPFDGSRQPFDGPPFEGDRNFDGPRFDGPPEFFDRNNRRFEEREHFSERGWNGDRDRERGDWDRRNEWDDRRRDRRSRDHDDRFNRDRNDRRRNFDERRRDDRNSNSRDDRSMGRDDRSVPRDDKSATKDDKSSAPKEDTAKTGTSREERRERRDKDRKSRWGAAEERVTNDEAEKAKELSEISEVTSNENTQQKHGEDVSSQEEQNVQKFAASEAQEMIQSQSETRSDNQQNENVIQESSNSAENYETSISGENIAPSYDREDKQNNEREEQSNYSEHSNTGNVDNETKDSSSGDYNNQNRNTDDVINEKSYDKERSMDYEPQESNTGDYNREENETSYAKEQHDSQSGEKESSAEERQPEIKDSALSLYDAGEAIDTSFATVEKEMPAPDIEKDKAWENNESSKGDIFSQEKEAEPQSTETQSNAESKEGVA